jgi:hypothetical protein
MKIRDDLFLSDRVREHLKTGYPSVYVKVIDFDSARENYRRRFFMDFWVFLEGRFRFSFGQFSSCLN